MQPRTFTRDAATLLPAAFPASAQPGRSFGERVASDPGVLPCTRIAVHEGCSSLGARLGLECRGQERELGSQQGGRSLGARASRCTEERRGACLRRASFGLPAQGWAPRAGGGLWKLRSRCPCTPGTAATTRISGQNKRCSRAAVASGQHMTGGVCSFLHC